MCISACTHVPIAPMMELLDMLEICRFLECLVLPVQILHPSIDVWVIVPDRSQVAIEKFHIDGVKPYDDGVQHDVGRGQPIRENVGLISLSDVGFDLVKTFEQRDNACFVLFLGHCGGAFLQVF